jgi:oligopeptide/dipeptide ABC transporter ATP-binding protein
MNPEALLDVQALTVGFPGSTGEWENVVDGISLTVGSGERVGLVGESGSGKSLTALACLGLVPDPGRVVFGSVTIAGTAVLSMHEREISSIRGGEVGLAFQEATDALNPVFTVGFQIAETIAVHRGMNRREARDATLELLAEVAVDDPHSVAQAYPHELSGGQAQRVMLAAALAGQPRVLIADEPTSALDTVTQSRVLDLLDRLVDDHGLGLLLISHDLAIVEGMVERMHIMYGGRIVEEGPAQPVFSAPFHPYTRMLLASRPGRRSAAGGGTDTGNLHSCRPAETGCRFRNRCPDAVTSCAVSEPQLIEADLRRRVRCPIAVAGPQERPDAGQ